MSDSPFFYGLRPYQIPHVQNLLRALLYCGAALDASQTGTGKTFCTLAVARVLGASPLIIGPKAAKAEWEMAGEKMGVPVEFINYEKARRESYGLGREKKWGSGSFWEWSIRPQLLVFDECHLASGATSLNGKLLRSAKKAAQYVLALSATAADNPAHLKNLGIALGLFESKNYYHWLMRHGMKPGVFGGLELTKDKDKARAGMAKIHAQIFPKRGARMQRDLIPDFPKTLIDVKMVEVESAGRVMEELSKTSEFNDPQEYIRLRQELDDLLVDPVVEMALGEIAEGRKVVVFPKFVRTLDALAKKLGAVTIDGRQTGDAGDVERRRIKEAFQNNDLDCVIVNQQAGGAGLSLHDPTGQVERTAFIFPCDSGRTLKQIFGRVHRDGGAFSRQFLLGFRGTLQEQILLTNLEKIRRIGALNNEELDSLRLI